MADFYDTWSLVRGRFVAGLDGLSEEGLHFRLHPGTLTIGEMALHVGGVEVFFATQLLGVKPEGIEARLEACARDGVVNESPFPFLPESFTREFVAEALAIGAGWVEPLLLDPTPEIRARRITSALGPEIDGTGAFARLAYHPAYHHGQLYLLRTAPGFPA